MPPDRPRPGLTRDRVVQEALALAAEQGTDQLTLRPLAARLGVSAPALYRHVDSRGTLMELMLEHRLAAVPRVPDGLDWRATFDGSAQRIWSVYRPCPGLAAESLDGRAATEETRTEAEQLVGVLVDAGLARPAAERAAVCWVHWALSFLASVERRQGPGVPFAQLPDRLPDPVREVYDQGAGYLLAGLAAEIAAATAA
jgi:AcrR family transcriptional regulator